MGTPSTPFTALRDFYAEEFARIEREFRATSNGRIATQARERLRCGPAYTVVVIGEHTRESGEDSRLRRCAAQASHDFRRVPANTRIVADE